MFGFSRQGRGDDAGCAVYTGWNQAAENRAPAGMSAVLTHSVQPCPRPEYGDRREENLRATLAQREIFERARADLLRAWEINDHNLMTAAQLVMVKVLREMGFRSEAENRAEATRKVNIKLIQEGRPPPWLKLLSSSRRRRLRRKARRAWT